LHLRFHKLFISVVDVHLIPFAHLSLLRAMKTVYEKYTSSLKVATDECQIKLLFWLNYSSCLFSTVL